MTVLRSEAASVLLSAGPAFQMPDRMHERPEASASALAAILAHRLRSLVASIEGFAGLLGDAAGEPDQRDLVLRILEGTARIEQILADLSFFGRPVDPVLVPVPVAEVLERVEMFLGEAERGRVRLVTDLAPGVELLADPDLVHQALLVLIQNALEAEPRAEAQLRVWQEEQVVVFAFWNPGRIPLPNPEHAVFQPFFTTKAQNLGLGLTLARRIAEAHWGTLALVHTDEHAGTRFELRLPGTAWERG